VKLACWSLKKGTVVSLSWVVWLLLERHSTSGDFNILFHRKQSSTQIHSKKSAFVAEQ